MYPNRKYASFLWALLALYAVTASVTAQQPPPAAPAGSADIAKYRMASRAEEVALARSAAPASISDKAEVLVLGEHGYESAVKGTNGFVCLVERSWLASLEDPQFYNPRIRGPDCLNPPAVKSVLPVDLERTRWVLAGLSKDELVARTRSSPIARENPAPGSMGYMLSKQGHLSDTDGHWHPHLMFFEPHTALATLGANLKGSPLLGQEGTADEATVLFIPVDKWSDGSPASSDSH